MNVWTSVFLHQFLDGNPLNYRALPGSLTMEPDGLVVAPTPPPEERGFLLAVGHTLHHRFDQVVTDVIGLDMQFDVDFRPGDRVSARLDLSNTGISLIADLGPDLARVQLHLGTTQVALSIPPVVHSPFRLHGRWHTHGQAHLWANGTLVAYRPDAVAGGAFSVIDLQLSGRSDGAGPARGRPRVRSTAVKVLRRDGPIGYLDELLPVRIGDGLTPECARRMAGKQQEAMRQIRAFMTASIARLTRAWSQGDVHEPFSSEAIRAQQAAVEAARAFVLMVSGRGGTSAAHLNERLGSFLAVLRDADPQGYAELVASMEALPLTLDPECRAPIEQIAQAQAERLAPVVTLLDSIWTTARAPGGSHV